MSYAVQFYAFTPETAPVGETTPYLQAFKEVSDLVTIAVRGRDGQHASITIPPAEAMSLSIALGTSKFAHEIVAARQERRALAESESEETARMVATNRRLIGLDPQ